MQETEEFWAGDFGTEYTNRNQVDPAARVPFFRELLGHTRDVRSVCELGANRGHNLRALQMIDSALELTGIEINSAACAELRSIHGVAAHEGSIASFAPSGRYDLVMTSGVLIHISPDDLPAVFDKIATLARRYVLINEYFNPTPVEVSYRGFAGKLFKRDFAADFLDRHRDFETLAYGFLWKRAEPAWDNSTWTLLGQGR